MTGAPSSAQASFSINLPFTLFEPGNTVSKSFILVAQRRDHLAQHVEFFARRDVHVPQQPFHLTARRGLDLTPNTLRRPGGIGHELGDVIEQAFGRHRVSAPLFGPLMGDGCVRRNGRARQG